MLKKILIFILSLTPVISVAQITKGYKTTEAGLHYKFIVDAKQPKSKVGYMVKVLLTYSSEKDSVVFSSSMIGEPAEFQLTAPAFKGDAMEALALMGAGDSAHFLINADSMFKGNELPAYCKPGSFMKLAVRMLTSLDMETYSAQKQQAAQEQIAKDDKIIQDYLKERGLTAQKTQTGMYYIVEKQGDGARVENGKEVTVNYTGKLLDGTIFDSSLNPGRQPFVFKIGMHQVIAGWDEGIALFNVGGKGTLFIPSALAYGDRGAGGLIKPNSVLIFDIEVLDVK